MILIFSDFEPIDDMADQLAVHGLEFPPAHRMWVRLLLTATLFVTPTRIHSCHPERSVAESKDLFPEYGPIDPSAALGMTRGGRDDKRGTG
jgi:hypothetical protein